ncbi:MAG: hypothetical protein KKA99_03475 [Gammaproteobacteria bacterium]|nr:hypothetical protein [Gammaproteobacteria bacterium]
MAQDHETLHPASIFQKTTPQPYIDWSKNYCLQPIYLTIIRQICPMGARQICLMIKINGFPVGILNCYEAEFPELSRILAVKGAKLIVIPTAADTYWKMYNGQWTDVRYPDISKLLLPAFSYANNIFISYINHAGYEFLGKDFWHYEGNSTIVDPHGKVVLSANKDQATLLIADVVPKYYGPTHPENANYLRDRRPRLYEELLKTKVKFDGDHVYPSYPEGEYIYPGFPK